ncbi:phosphotransferase family protein [Labrenzia sp. 011]|uniref:phosphotransferase family protein n=1 Tax=Labrenzia sp. 011 TaxID=2171494 RepID=UPI000D506499|nr:phosphotransferase family protein [Labrenzia sp. 011]PVB62277.1 phosphotransferase family protein [Labrenzia sp. 011]
MVQDRADPDLRALTDWLGRNLPGFSGPVRLDKFNRGQSNPTYRLRAASGDYVLRRKPPGVLLKSAHAVEREFRVQKALAGSEVPVARMHVLCEDETVIGSAFYVMAHVAGRSFDDPRLPETGLDTRVAIYEEMNRVLAAIHGIDLQARGLADFGPAGNYYRRQIDRWTRQYRASETGTIAAMDELISWLDANVPAEDGRRTLVHGDYRIDNLLFAEDGPACVAVLDWELSTIGHPFADLAALIMQWRLPPGAEGRGLAGIDRAALGLPEDQAFIDGYCARTGLSGIPDFGFYLAFCFFRMGAILQGVRKRALDGNASNPEIGLRLASAVPRYAAGGLEAAKQGQGRT